jgi:hypothetical protein
MKNLMLACVLVLGAGCTASFFMVGSTPHSGPPPASKASWVVSGCTTADGRPTDKPDATYYIDDTSFYEIAANGQGARITNTWSDAKGRYFFTRVKTSAAWLYFIPADGASPPVRYVYFKGAYDVTEENGIIKPNGTPSATCGLQPRG